MVAYLLPAILLVLAALLVIGNWWALWNSYRLRKQGSHRHVSSIPVIAQLLVGFAALSSAVFDALIPYWLFWMVALADVSLYSVIYAPIRLMREQAKAQKGANE